MHRGKIAYGSICVVDLGSSVKNKSFSKQNNGKQKGGTVGSEKNSMDDMKSDGENSEWDFNIDDYFNIEGDDDGDYYYDEDAIYDGGSRDSNSECWGITNPNDCFLLSKLDF